MSDPKDLVEIFVDLKPTNRQDPRLDFETEWFNNKRLRSSIGRMKFDTGRPESAVLPFKYDYIFGRHITTDSQNGSLATAKFP